MKLINQDVTTEALEVLVSFIRFHNNVKLPFRLAAEALESKFRIMALHITSQICWNMQTHGPHRQRLQHTIRFKGHRKKKKQKKPSVAPATLSQREKIMFLLSVSSRLAGNSNRNNYCPPTAGQVTPSIHHTDPFNILSA